MSQKQLVCSHVLAIIGMQNQVYRFPVTLLIKNTLKVDGAWTIPSTAEMEAHQQKQISHRNTINAKTVIYLFLIQG